MPRMTAVCVACLFFAPLPAAAQATFAPVRAGQEVRVTDAAGARIAGRIEALSKDALTVNGRMLTSSQIITIERKGDSLWNGVAIGAAAGLLLPLLPSEACSNQSRAGCIASGIETGALLGLAIDAIHRGYTIIYRADGGRPAARVVPRVDVRAHRLAVALSIQ